MVSKHVHHVTFWGRIGKAVPNPNPPTWTIIFGIFLLSKIENLGWVWVEIPDSLINALGSLLIAPNES